MSLYSDILRILDNSENMSQHSRRSYWTDQIILMVRQDAVQRVEALPWAFVDPPGVLDTVIAAIKGDNNE